MEYVGKYPSDDEANIYDISTELPVFMSVSEDKDTSEEYAQYLKKSNTYFTNKYK